MLDAICFNENFRIENASVKSIGDHWMMLVFVFICSQRQRMPKVTSTKQLVSLNTCDDEEEQDTQIM